jgi:hypothetical protein
MLEKFAPDIGKPAEPSCPRLFTFYFLSVPKDTLCSQFLFEFFDPPLQPNFVWIISHSRTPVNTKNSKPFIFSAQSVSSAVKKELKTMNPPSQPSILSAFYPP